MIALVGSFVGLGSGLVSRESSTSIGFSVREVVIGVNRMRVEDGVGIVSISAMLDGTGLKGFLVTHLELWAREE